MSSVVVLDHIFFLNTKTFKIPTKVDSDTTDAIMGINENDQEPGVINKNTDITDDKEPKENFTNTNRTDSGTNYDMGLNKSSVLKINVISRTQDDTSALNSRTGGTQDYPSMLTSRTCDSNKSSNVTPDKGHGKDLVTNSPLWKDPIHQR